MSRSSTIPHSGHVILRTPYATSSSPWCTNWSSCRRRAHPIPAFSSTTYIGTRKPGRAEDRTESCHRPGRGAFYLKSVFDSPRSDGRHRQRPRRSRNRRTGLVSGIPFNKDRRKEAAISFDRVTPQSPKHSGKFGPTAISRRRQSPARNNRDKSMPMKTTTAINIALALADPNTT